MEILDSTTLQPLQSLEFTWEGLAHASVLIFSPDGRRLTYYGNSATRTGPDLRLCIVVLVVSWDLQTGCVVSAIECSKTTKSRNPSVVYSMDGRMVVALDEGSFGGTIIISIFDVVSGIYMHSVECSQLESSHLYHIWTQGESIQFVTAGSTRIVIWEVGFALGAMCTEAKVLSAPEKIDGVTGFEFLPASNRAAFASFDWILVWDAQDSKSLLFHTVIEQEPLARMTFSSNGYYFACLTGESGVYLWKESPIGYVLCGKLSPNSLCPRPLLSPNGKSIITSRNSMIELWHTSSFTTTSSSTPAQLSKKTEKFILDLLPDRSMAVFARKKDKAVIILDLQSSTLPLTIETPMEVYGLGVVKDTVVAIGHNRVISWNIPEGSPHPDVRLDVGNSVQTIDLTHALEGGLGNENQNSVTAALMSPDFQYIALTEEGRPFALDGKLHIYGTSTGQCLYHTTTLLTDAIWFSPGGDNIWCANCTTEAEVWTITGDNMGHAMVVKCIEDRSWGSPWESSYGYQVASDGWIFSPNGKRLLMLPPLWQSYPVWRVWNGNFLALTHSTLPGPVIIKLEP